MDHAGISDGGGDGLDDIVVDFGPARDIGDAEAVDCFTGFVKLTGTTTGSLNVVSTGPILVQGCDKNHTHCGE